MRPLLVGEDNPRSADPRFALWPFPAGTAGSALCGRILGLDADAYLGRFDRANLCRAGWDEAEARERACELARSRMGRPVVLLGRKVAGAFGLDLEEFGRSGRFLRLPHPSGRCRTWNDASNIGRAREALRELGVPL